MNKKLEDKIRKAKASPEYAQDIMDLLVEETNALESKVKAQAELLERAKPIVLKAQVYSRTYGGNPPTVIEEWLSEYEKLKGEEAAGKE